MVNQWTGEWTEEKDYSTYPKEKWCDYDYMAAWIREQKYEPKTSMENLITNIFLHYDCEIEEESSSYNTENGNFEGTYIEAVQAYVADTELNEFDYEAQIGVIEMFTEEYFSKWFDIIPEHDAKILWDDGDRSFLVLSIEDGTDRYADCFESFEEIKETYPNILFGLNKVKTQ